MQIKIPQPLLNVITKKNLSLSNYNPKPHWSEAPMVRNTISPKHH